MNGLVYTTAAAVLLDEDATACGPHDYHEDMTLVPRASDVCEHI